MCNLYRMRSQRSEVVAAVTYELLRATNRLASANSEPNVVVTLEPSGWDVTFAELVIENTGPGPAFDVRLRFDPPLSRLRDNDVKPLPLDAISVLRPGQMLRNWVGDSLKHVETSYRVTIDCKRSPRSSERIVTTYTLSMAHYLGYSGLNGGGPDYFVAREMKKVREALEALTRGHKRPAFDIYSSQDRNDERAALEAHWKRQEQQENPKPVRKPRVKTAKRPGRSGP